MSSVAEAAIRITPQNLAVYAALHRELKAHLSEIVEWMKLYPVEIEFKGLRFVFDSEQDILDAIELIGSALLAHHAG